MPKAEAPKIEMLLLEEIKPYWRNARKNERAIPAVRKSIERYGFNQPLVIDKKNVIIVGHTRYRAAVELGLAEVPCIRSTLSEKKAKEYRIADNKTGEIADWDMSALIPELRGLDADSMAAFFEHDTRGLAKLLEESAGVDITPVQQSDVDAILDRGTGTQRLVTEAKAGQYLKVTCPHCGDDFMLDRNTVLTHPGDKDQQDAERG